MDISVSLQKILQTMLRWFAKQDKAAIDRRTKNEFAGPCGVRVKELNRDTQRAIATWVAIYPESEFNLEIWVDTLEYVAGIEPAKKANRFATHTINVVQKDWNHTYVPLGGKAVRSRRKIWLSEEAMLKPIYSDLLIDESANIASTVARLLCASRVEQSYFQRHHPNISFTDKRDAEILFAMGARRSTIPFIYERLRLSDWDIVVSLLANPDITKQLLYPPDILDFKQLFTLVTRYRLNRPSHNVFFDN